MTCDFECVYTMTEWYDGPRRGIADFEGKPHLYEADSDDGSEEYIPTFRLTPVSTEVLALALEDWAIWERWELAFSEGRTSRDTHPALPEERERHEQLTATIQRALVSNPSHAIRAHAEFRGRARLGLALEVRWERC